MARLAPAGSECAGYAAGAATVEEGLPTARIIPRSTRRAPGTRSRRMTGMIERLLLSAALLLGSVSVAHAEVTVSDAWIRGTVPGQRATGAFMQLRSSGDASLVAVATPAAKAAEIHTMVQDNGVMKMRAIASLPLPAGKTVEMGPGGYHVMLLDLARPMKEGEIVAVTLTFADASGRTTTQQVQATVRALNAGPMKH